MVICGAAITVLMTQGQPVLFDPAVYYGDRETDIAMTELFGGFPAAFYAAYRESYPLDPGYDVRKTLYNLYHILNHLNLFGGGYRHQAEQMMSRLLAELLEEYEGVRGQRGMGLTRPSQQVSRQYFFCVGCGLAQNSSGSTSNAQRTLRAGRASSCPRHSPRNFCNFLREPDCTSK